MRVPTSIRRVLRPIRSHCREETFQRPTSYVLRDVRVFGRISCERRQRIRRSVRHSGIRLVEPRRDHEIGPSPPIAGREADAHADQLRQAQEAVPLVEPVRRKAGVELAVVGKLDAPDVLKQETVLVVQRPPKSRSSGRKIFHASAREAPSLFCRSDRRKTARPPLPL